jgi:hypothetical protein
VLMSDGVFHNLMTFKTGFQIMCITWCWFRTERRGDAYKLTKQRSQFHTKDEIVWRWIFWIHWVAVVVFYVYWGHIRCYWLTRSEMSPEGGNGITYLLKTRVLHYLSG